MDDTEVTVADEARGAVDASIPNVARVYDFMLGGKDNFPADRAAAEQLLAAFPEAREGVRQNRAFLRRVVEHLAGPAGIRQFLDIGTGLPTQKNVHEVARAVAPDARVVYVDNDPVVCVHGRSLLADDEQVVMVEADLRRPEEILADPDTRRLIDLDQPVALLLVAILHFVADEDDPYGIVARLRDALAPGSYLAIVHMLDAEERRADADQVRQVYSRSSTGVYPRTREQVMRFFGDFELLDNDLFISRELIQRFAGLGWGAVARKPIP
ncbi:MAG TPA: SAM-dependent methyltransferase [Actinomycetes bacterium]